MTSEGIDVVTLSKLISHQTDYITCLECCKYYIAPETAPCGHSLCHNCWWCRKSCPQCNLPVERKQIKLNLPLQKLTEHVQTLVEAFENKFKLTLNELVMDSEPVSVNDPSKNVTEWLASSQNHFSEPAQSSENMSEDLKRIPNPSEVSISKIQIHTITRKKDNIQKSEKIVHIPIPQDDWDKIEVIEDSDVKNKENVIGPMDIEPFYVDESEYTANNPRRSSRNRELKVNDANLNTNIDKDNSKDEMDKKSNTAKQNWNNVKKMRKEFSKLNKINRNKLNVSIEMCKKSQTKAKTNVKQNENLAQAYEIDENTPQVALTNVMTEAISSKQNENEISNSKVTTIENSNSKFEPDKLPPIPDISQSLGDYSLQRSKLSNQVNETNIEHKDETQKSQLSNQTKETCKNLAEKGYQTKMPFYKKGALYAPNVNMTNEEQEQNEMNSIKTVNHNIESDTIANDDIEITIKVGNTITNIVIKKKNDVQLKVKSDREVQTTSCPNNSPQTVETRNVSINIDSNNEVNVEHNKIVPTRQNESTPAMKQSPMPLKSSSTKKNTASADTGTVNFEITESVEKELSNIMECAEIEDKQKTKSNSTSNKSFAKNSTLNNQRSQKTSQTKNTPKPQAHQEDASQNNTQKPQTEDEEDLQCLNDDDPDIFQSDTVKDTNVNLHKHAKNKTPSEILVSTHKNRTQKTEKRNRDENVEDLPVGKKQKVNYSEKISHNPGRSVNQPDSESLTYDNVMGTVFASIDADMEELSQNPASQKLSNTKNKSQTQKGTQKAVEGPQKDGTSGQGAMACTLNTNDFCNVDSENIFSVCVDKEDVIEASVPKPNEVPVNEPDPIVEDFLTPVLSVSSYHDSGGAARGTLAVEVHSDDSESVVEDTPQKAPSFSKINQKSIAIKDQKASQQMHLPRPQCDKSIGREKTNILNLDTYSEIDNANDITVIQTKKSTSETPLTINKFVDHIQYNSTPLARKSLNFESDIDPEQTLCPTNVARTTQEKEFLTKAFEDTPTSQIVVSRNLGGKRGKRLCIAGSCLSAGEIAKLKGLCSQYKWSFVDKYTRDLTHLVVGVDEENKAQRSVKYMCALAASKWIVSFGWVEKCLEAKAVVGEEVYEALDSTGEPGPRRSRVSSRKLFQGITFYCMEPFIILDVHTLKEMLESSGGRVVSAVSEVRITDTNHAPAVLLAEPESTQEDRFMYLAMELGIVPVNYEWVLNCLGGYSLSSLRELLLCPYTLLPRIVDDWPDPLMQAEED